MQQIIRFFQTKSTVTKITPKKQQQQQQQQQQQHKSTFGLKTTKNTRKTTHFFSNQIAKELEFTAVIKASVFDPISNGRCSSAASMAFSSFKGQQITPWKINMAPENNFLEVWRIRTWKPSFSGAWLVLGMVNYLAKHWLGFYTHSGVSLSFCLTKHF